MKSSNCLLLPLAGDKTAGLPFCAAKSKDSSTGTSTSTVRPERSEAKSKDSFAKTPIHRPRSRPNHMPLPSAGEAADRPVSVAERSVSPEVKSPPSSPSGTFSRQREKDSPSPLGRGLG